MHKFELNEYFLERCVEDSRNMLCLWNWNYFSSIVTLDLWNVVTLKDIYVFFMTEKEMDLDDDLIWDTMKLLLKNE